jgi:RNA polymerase sigma-70 factor (ECF subfamily)
MERFAVMTEKISETNLLAECKNGNREAFESLYNRHQRRVFSVALNFFGGDIDQASDITQQVFLKLFTRNSDFRGDAEFTTWLYRVTVNACIDEQRKNRRFFGLAEFFGLEDTKMKQEDKVQQKQISDEVQKVIATLKPKFRLPILLKYVEGLSYDEIAKVLDCSIGTVSSRLNRGHKLLAQKLGHLKGQV